jgi:hypothetical protein
MIIIIVIAYLTRTIQFLKYTYKYDRRPGSQLTHDCACSQKCILHDELH